MPATTPWYVIEAQVLAHVDALKTGTATAAETAYAALPKVNDTDIRDAVFPRMFVRRTIVQSHQQIVAWVCSTENHPRRLPFRDLISLVNTDPLPTSITLIGAVADASTSRTLTKLNDPQQVDAIRLDTGAMSTLDLFYYAIDGNTFYCTVGSALIEVFRYPNPAPTDAALAALFDATTDLIALDDEFENAITFLAVAVLAGKRYPEQAANFMALAKDSLDSLGVKVSQSDFTSQLARAA